MERQALWNEQELVAATGGILKGQIRGPLNGVEIDSRVVSAGDIFVAIKGDRLDGHDYAAAALKANAGVAIVSRSTAEMEQAGAVLIVDDPLQALRDMAVAARARSDAKIIAVTGSVGKTTTKDGLRLALSACGETHASVASFNNHWGVPLTLARMPRESAYAVFEIGMNHSGEITPLVNMVRPHVAIITIIAEGHLGHFNSVSEIAAAKAEIFSGVEPGGAVLLPRDNEFYDYLDQAAQKANITNRVSFGCHDDAMVRLLSVKLHAECSCAKVMVEDDELCVKIGQPGRHVVTNVLAILGAIKLAGADLARASLALSKMTAANGRGVRFKLRIGDGLAQVIDESYNANPTSMRAALELLKESQPIGRGRKIAVLGDMLELGTHGERLHSELSAAIDTSSTDVLYACGPLMKSLWDAVAPHRRGAYAATSQDLQAKLLAALRPGDVIMIKGSLGSKMQPLVAALKERFEVVA